MTTGSYKLHFKGKGIVIKYHLPLEVIVRILYYDSYYKCTSKYVDFHSFYSDDIKLQFLLKLLCHDKSVKIHLKTLAHIYFCWT